VPKFKKKQEFHSEILLKFEKVPNCSDFSEKFSKIFIGFKDGSIGRLYLLYLINRFE
jgi:hypothetical protein